MTYWSPTGGNCHVFDIFVSAELADIQCVRNMRGPGHPQAPPPTAGAAAFKPIRGPDRLFVRLTIGTVSAPTHVTIIDSGFGRKFDSQRRPISRTPSSRMLPSVIGGPWVLRLHGAPPSSGLHGENDHPEEQQRDYDANNDELWQDVVTLCLAQPPRLLK